MTLIDDGAVIRILLDGWISSLCSRDDLFGKFATQIRWNKNVVRRNTSLSCVQEFSESDASGCLLQGVIGANDCG